MCKYSKELTQLRDDNGWDNKEWARRCCLNQHILDYISSGNDIDEDTYVAIKTSTLNPVNKGADRLLRFKSPIVIATCIHKGGSGKTSCSMGISEALADMGYNVLLIDSDSQRDATSSFLDLNNNEDFLLAQQKNLYMSLASGRDLKENIIFAPSDGVENLDIVASDTRMASIEAMLTAQSSIVPDVDFTFEKTLSGIKKDNYYDFVFIDMDKTIGQLNRIILTACTHILVVSECAFFHLNGINVIQQQCEDVKKKTNPNLEMLGIVLNKYAKRKVITQETVSTIDEAWPGLRFKNTIRVDSAIEKSQWNNTPLIMYDKNSNGMKDMIKVAEEIIEKVSHMAV